MTFLKRWWSSALLPIAWLYLVGDMLRVRYRDPFGRSPTHPGYGENLPGDVLHESVFGLVEIVVLSAVLRPWRDGPIWPRALLAVALFAPWSLLAMMMGMHAGSISATHAFWRFGLLVPLAVTFAVSGVRVIHERSTTTVDPGA